MTSQPAATTVTDLRFTPEELLLTWKNDTFSMYRALWLRDNDPLHRDPQTGQRTVSLTELPAEPRIASVDPLPPGHLTVRWEDGATSVFLLAWLRTVDPERRLRTRPMRMPWLGQPATCYAWCGYAEWLADLAAREKWLHRAARDGLAFLHHVPLRDQAVLDVAAQLGHVRETNFGRVFEVLGELQSTTQPGNTGRALRVQTDDPYRDPVPGFLLLQCMASAGEGGESLFVDGLAAAERIRARDPDAFTVLSQTLVRYRYRDEHVDLCAERSMIDLDSQGQFRAIYYNDRAIAPLSMPTPQLQKYYKAYRSLATLLEQPGRCVSYRMQPGELVLVDNTRVLHGRAAFSSAEKETAGAAVLLRGCYIDADGLYSALAVLAHKGSPTL